MFVIFVFIVGWLYVVCFCEKKIPTTVDLGIRCHSLGHRYFTTKNIKSKKRKYIKNKKCKKKNNHP